jgi:outer membrane receptor protein involved in Fe transport
VSYNCFFTAEEYFIRIIGCGQKKGATAVRRKAMIMSFALVLFVALSVTAGTTGKIAGRVTDTSGNPLIGATVMVVGTSYGAMTDANGEYFIINLTPGIYSIEAFMVGMSKKTAEGVAVVVDQTSPMNFSLDNATVGNTTITVTDSRGMIMMDATETFHVVGREEIKTMPVSGIADVVNRQAGATDRGGLHMRGGRSGEVTYMVDGVAQVDPTSRFFSSSIPMSGVAETSIISGGFGAEYGNAQSGVVNIITREGGRNYTGSVNWNGNNWQELGLASDWHWGGINPAATGDDAGEWRWCDVSPFSEARTNLEATVGGPEPFTSYLLPAIGLDIPGDMRMFFSGEYLQTGGGMDGRYAYQFNEWQTTYTGNLKLTYKPNPKTKINLTGYLMDTSWGWTDWAWHRYEQPYIETDTLSENYGDTLAFGEDVLWGLPTLFRENYSFGASITQTLSDATFMEIRLNQFQTARDYKIYNRPGDSLNTTEFFGENFTWDEWQNSSTAGRVQDTNSFYRAGRNRSVWGERRSTISTFRTDITSQINQQHQLKAGVEVKYYDVFNYYIDQASGGNIYAGRYHVFPNAGAAYIQDKMEYRGMIVNAGLRFDYYDARFDDYPADLTDPINEGAQLGDDDYIKNPISVPIKYHLSPRIGFSHPITERDVLHFTYGHYFQTPNLNNMYSGSNYDLSGAFPLVGNPDLSAEETISYEVGVKHMFDDITMIDVTGYYKDITGLLDTQKNFYTAINSYDIYVNGDYGNVRGVELNLVRRPSDFWSGTVNYTYSVAMGKSSSGRQNYDYEWENWIIPMQESPLDWDERHRVNAELDFRIPRGEGPRLGDTPFLEGFGAHVSWTWGSGFPYSPANQGTEQPTINSSRYPWTTETTLKVNKTFWIGPVILDAYCQVNNLFNRHNILALDPAWYDADQDGDGEPDNDPTGQMDDPYVFSRPRMIRFGLGFEW